jgi:type IV fimbrial biogenesis protein FimT
MATNHIQTRGLTLVELMITLAITSILITGVAPSFSASVKNSRLVTQLNTLHTSFSLARSEAINRNSNITVCPSATSTSCAGDWQDGWIVFVDDDSDGSVNNGDEIISVHGALPEGSTLISEQAQVIYAGSGLAEAGSNGTFTLCDARGAAKAKGIIIGTTGRPRHAVDTDSNGILQDGNNDDLVCL